MWWIVGCVAAAVKKTAGTFEPSGACHTFGIELLLALVDGDKMVLGGFPSFVGGRLDLPRLHFLVVEHFGGIHALHVVLDLRGVGGRDTDVSAKLLLLVELAGELRDVAREVPLYVKGFGGLLLFERRDDAPFVAEMLDDRFDRLAAVAHVVVFELFDVRGIDGLAHDLVDDECVDGFLLPKLLACEVVEARDRRSICERGGVREARGDDWRWWEAIDDDVRVARDGAILGVGEDECEMAMASAPTRCFDGCRNFCDLLPEMVDGGGRWLADDFVKRERRYDGPYGFVDGGLVCGG